MIELMANSGGYLSEDCCARQVARPLLEALAGLHALGVIHRHLKPEHLLCSNTSLEIVDFTDAAHRKQHCLNCRVGDLHYMAPEVLSKPRTEDIFHQVRREGGCMLLAAEPAVALQSRPSKWCTCCACQAVHVQPRRAGIRH